MGLMRLARAGGLRPCRTSVSEAKHWNRSPPRGVQTHIGTSILTHQGVDEESRTLPPEYEPAGPKASQAAASPVWKTARASSVAAGSESPGRRLSRAWGQNAGFRKLSHGGMNLSCRGDFI
jgi:hypothetical protein